MYDGWCFDQYAQRTRAQDFVEHNLYGVHGKILNCGLLVFFQQLMGIFFLLVKIEENKNY